MTHSPTPWSASRTVLRDANGNSIASGGNNRAIVGDQLADCLKLAAAAPALLAALKTLVIGCESAGHDSGIAWALEQARAAIDNATRETS